MARFLLHALSFGFPATAKENPGCRILQVPCAQGESLPRTPADVRLPCAIPSLAAGVSAAGPPNVSGCCMRSRSKSSLAVQIRLLSSQTRTLGQTSSNGSSRVRHQRSALGFGLCVGRTSPSFQSWPGWPGIAPGHHRDAAACARFHRGEAGDVALHGSDLVQQPKWVQRGKHRTQLLLRRFGDIRGSEESRARGLRGLVVLANARTDALLPDELEGWLEEVHEEPRTAVEPRQGLGGSDALQSSVADHAPNDRPFFCSTHA